MSNAEILPQIINHLRKEGHISSTSSITSSQLAKSMETESKFISWALAAQFRHGDSLLRREKAPKGRGKGWVFWLGTRKAKVVPSHRRGNGVARHAPIPTHTTQKGIGIYFCRENAEDLLLTFDEARELYTQLTIVFGS